MKFAFLIEPPFNYLTQNGAVTGCDVELAKTILKRIGADEFDPIEAEFAELLPGLEKDHWKMTTGLFSTRERRKNASFSTPIWALPDGLLVARNNPKNLVGYRSIVDSPGCVLSVIRDQFQHKLALKFGLPDERILIFETYLEAANSVLNGRADAYASVGRAHTGYLDLNSSLELGVVTVPSNEILPAFGCFGFKKNDSGLRHSVNQALKEYLGTTPHRAMMHSFGFSDIEIDLVVNNVG